MSTAAPAVLPTPPGGRTQTTEISSQPRGQAAAVDQSAAVAGFGGHEYAVHPLDGDEGLGDSWRGNAEPVYEE